MKEEQLRQLWKQEAQKGMKGWEFSHLKDRWRNESLPWNYSQVVVRYLKDQDILLDMGTGGGERLQTFHHPANNTYVTEAWQPNIDLLKKTLAKGGVHVLPVQNAVNIPMPDQTFDIITNGHAAFSTEIVSQKLKSGGIFVTQQVGATNNFSLSQFLLPEYKPAFPNNTLLRTVSGFEQAGLTIQIAKQAFPKMQFYDVGAIVYYASVIPWEFPGFSVDSCFQELLKLERLIKQRGFISTNEDRFLVVAQKR